MNQHSHVLPLHCVIFLFPIKYLSDGLLALLPISNNLHLFALNLISHSWLHSEILSRSCSPLQLFSSYIFIIILALSADRLALMFIPSITSFTQIRYISISIKSCRPPLLASLHPDNLSLITVHICQPLRKSLVYSRRLPFSPHIFFSSHISHLCGTFLKALSRSLYHKPPVV